LTVATSDILSTGYWINALADWYFQVHQIRIAFATSTDLC